MYVGGDFYHSFVVRRVFMTYYFGPLFMAGASLPSLSSFRVPSPFWLHDCRLATVRFVYLVGLHLLDRATLFK